MPYSATVRLDMPYLERQIRANVNVRMPSSQHDTDRYDSSSRASSAALCYL